MFCISPSHYYSFPFPEITISHFGIQTSNTFPSILSGWSWQTLWKKERQLKENRSLFPNTRWASLSRFISFYLASLLNLVSVHIFKSIWSSLLWIPSAPSTQGLRSCSYPFSVLYHRCSPSHDFYPFFCKSSLDTMFLLSFSVSLHRKTSEKGLLTFFNSIELPTINTNPHPFSFQFLHP